MTFTSNYDKEYDILYVHVNKARPSISEEIIKNVLLRRDVVTNEISGVTFLTFHKTIEKEDFSELYKMVPGLKKYLEINKLKW